MQRNQETLVLKVNGHAQASIDAIKTKQLFRSRCKYVWNVRPFTCLLNNTREPKVVLVCPCGLHCTCCYQASTARNVYETRESYNTEGHDYSLMYPYLWSAVLPRQRPNWC